MALTRERDRPVLIGFGDAYAAIEAAWSLQAAGFRVAAFTRPGTKPPLRRVRDVELHQVCPPEDDVRRTVADVRAWVRSLAPVAYLPLDDAAVWVGDGLASEEVPIAGPTSRAVAYCLDKSLQITAAQEAGLRVPPTQVVETLRDTEPDEYPAVVKPAKALYEVNGGLVRLTGGVCANEAEFARIATRRWYPPLLIQPLIRGTGEGLFGLVTKAGVVGWSSHRRIRMLNPQGSASSACASRSVDESLLEPAARFMTEIGFRGLFMLEFLRDAEGRPWLMELNGRSWGSMALARRRGFEYPAWTVCSVLDDEFAPDVPERPPELVCRNMGMELVHLAFVLRGPSSTALTDWPRVWPTIRQLARISRRDCLYNWKRSEPHVLAADTANMLATYIRKAARSGR